MAKCLTVTVIARILETPIWTEVVQIDRNLYYNTKYIFPVEREWIRNALHEELKNV